MDLVPSLSNLFQKQLSQLPSQEHAAESASGQTPQQPDASSSNSLVDVTTLKGLSITATSPSSRRDTIWVRYQCDWGLTFYTRIDLRGYFHTYPHVGGPFQSLDQVNNAIDRYLHDRRDTIMCKERPEFYEVGKASVERGIRDSLFWPDGSKKMYVKSEPVDESRCWMLQLVQASLDKYNEDHNLFKDLALEVKDVVCYEVIYEGNCRYYHINFTTRTKGAKTTNNLFFAEVTRMPGEDGNLVVSCTCMVDHFDNGHCYGCESNMKHPNADAYSGGHSKVCSLEGECLGPNIAIAETMDDWKAEEGRVRQMFKGLGDPTVVARLMEPPKLNFGATKATDEEVECFMNSIMEPYDPNLCTTYGILDASAAERFRVALM
uniref:DUF3615 domain-containing protein n=1 Tax=Aegilops tauschii subsp. strangulata TaxID=200361 RepID=A0A453GHF1_AEGTS